MTIFTWKNLTVYTGGASSVMYKGQWVTCDIYWSLKDLVYSRGPFPTVAAALQDYSRWRTNGGNFPPPGDLIPVDFVNRKRFREVRSV